MMHTSKYTKLRNQLFACRCHKCAGMTLRKVHLGYAKCRYCWGTGLNRGSENTIRSLIFLSEYNV